MFNKNGNSWPFVIFIILLALGGSFFVYYYYFVQEQIPDYSVLEKRQAHFYGDLRTSISNIRVKVFYAVPKGEENNLRSNWREVTEESFDRAARFHNLQLRGLSEIDYDIFPEPVFLLHESLFYDSDSTDFGNPRGLVSVAEEIDARVLSEGGDMYDAEFASVGAGEYPVIGLIYEGVGASGGVIYETELGTEEEIAKSLGLPESIVYITEVKSAKGFFILNIAFLADSDLSALGPTFLYHELAHSFGLPDRDEFSGLRAENDIMGGGKRDPIEHAYLAGDLLRGLGILE